VPAEQQSLRTPYRDLTATVGISLLADVRSCAPRDTDAMRSRPVWLACVSATIVSALLGQPARAASTPAGHVVWTDTHGALLIGRPDGTVSRVALPSHTSLGDISASRAGDRVAFTLSDGVRTALWTAPTRARSSPTSPSRTRQLDTPEWSPRGSEVVYAHNIYLQGTTIEVVDVDVVAPVPRVIATTGGNRTFDVHWSPDGTQLSYLISALPYVTGGTYVVDARGTRSERVGEGGDPTFAGGAVWSPDGTRLLLCQLDGAGWFGISGRPLREITVRTHAVRDLGDGPCLTPTWSPDGRFTADVDYSQGGSQLILRTRDGALVRALGDAWGIGLAWTAR